MMKYTGKPLGIQGTKPKKRSWDVPPAETAAPHNSEAEGPGTSQGQDVAGLGSIVAGHHRGAENGEGISLAQATITTSSVTTSTIPDETKSVAF